MFEIGSFRETFQETMSFCLMEDQALNDLAPAGRFFHWLAAGTNSTGGLRPALNDSPASVDELCEQIDKMALRPLAPFRKFSPPLGQLLSLRDDQMNSLVSGIAMERASAIKSSGAIIDLGASSGRILYFEPSLSLFDGAAMLASGGFFDVETFPPSDTWIAYVGEERSPKFLSGYILSWVPESLVELVNDSLKFDPLESIRWADSVKKPFLNELRQAKLLP